MNYGPLVFLAAFFALSSSWFAFVLKPSMQVGRLQQTNTLGGAVTYPVGRPGLAHQGLSVYRAQGCMYCHSQQVGQTGTILEAVLADPGTNAPATLQALTQIIPNLSEESATRLMSELPKPVYSGTARPMMENALGALKTAGAKAFARVVPTGPDIARGWGKRRTVAEDFLFDHPVMTGLQRAGPDLANVGVRQPDPNWHLRHLYAPRSEVEGSTMPPYRYLFRKQRIGLRPSPDALKLTGKHAPAPGYEIVPTPDAVALTAYILSLRADAPLFSAPLSIAAPAPDAGTNATTQAGSTNNPAAPATTP